MRLKIGSLSLFLMLILFSCRKENVMTIENTGSPLLTSVKVVDQLYYEYLYNGANLVSTEESKYIFTLHRYNDLNQALATDYYSDNTLLSSDSLVVKNALNRKEWVSDANSAKGATMSYEYNSNGQLTNTMFSWPLNNNQEYSEFSYDVNGMIGRQTIYWGAKETGYIDYLYDGKSNLTEEKLYSVTSAGVPELSTTTQYEFDNYQNPFMSFKRLMTPGINTNQNNIIKETYTIHFKPGQGSDKVQTTTNTYTYDSKGFPVKKNSSVEYIY